MPVPPALPRLRGRPPGGRLPDDSAEYVLGLRVGEHDHGADKDGHGGDEPYGHLDRGNSRVGLGRSTGDVAPEPHGERGSAAPPMPWPTLRVNESTE